MPQLGQRVGRIIIRGFGFGEFECSAAPAPWSAEVTGANGKFPGGHATVDISASVCGPIECADAFAHASIRLRR